MYALSNEVEKHDITVNSVGTENVTTSSLKDTPGWSDEAIKILYTIGGIGDSMDIAPMVAFIASEEARFCTGEYIVIAGGR